MCFMNQKNKKKGFGEIIFLVLIVLFFSFLGASDVKAGSEHNVFGWAWSENLGWFSFNDMGLKSDGTLTDEYLETTNGGIAPGVPTDIPDNSNGYGIITPVTYGVNIEANGNLSGYAWSENLGWINFNPAPDTATYTTCGYPADPCYSAKVDLSGSYPVSGWARACSVFNNEQNCDKTKHPNINPTADYNSNTGGWDGWIRLQDDVYIDTVPFPAEFHKWFWGGNPDNDSKKSVIGWGTFNCYEGGASGENICVTDSDYKVVTTFSLNAPPKVGNMKVSPDYCHSSISFSWIYSDPDKAPQTRFQFQLDDNDDFSSQEVIRDYTGLLNPIGTVNSQSVTVVVNPPLDEINFNTTYYWRVKVYNNKGKDSGWYYGKTTTKTSPGDSFKTVSHGYPNPHFEIDPANKTRPLVNGKAIFNFNDISICYNNAGPDYLCSTQPKTGYKWWFNYDITIHDSADWPSPDSTVKGSVSSDPLYTQIGAYPVSLRICDDLGCCPYKNSVSVRPATAVPQWQEISPF